MCRNNRRFSFLLILGISAVLAVFSAFAQGRHVRVITIDDQIINPVAAEYIRGAIESAEADGAECLIIQLDTPGGLLTSTRTIVKELLNADVPIVVYVAPSGARAGSAGVFITLASNIAVMAPSTNIGAAHPVDLGGEGGDSWQKAIKELEEKLRELERRQEQPIPQPKEPVGERMPEGTSGEAERDEQEEGQTEKLGEEEESTGSTMGDKIMEDTLAWTRGIARLRGRNEEWAVDAVTKSVSATDGEALENNVIDFVCKDLNELLETIDGKEVEIVSGKVVLETKGAGIVYQDMNARQKILMAISNPNIAYILMMLGFFGLLFEVTHAGIGFPGIAGAICLILAFYSFQMLPVNYAGVLLILLAIVLFVAEAKVASYGLLTVGGLVCMTLGSIMLIDSPNESLRISNTVIFPMVLAMAVIIIFLVTLVVRSQSRKSDVGQDGLVGLIGTVETDLTPEGKVFVHGELWNARSSDSLGKGSKARVVEVDGMTVVVEKVKGD